MAGSILEVVSSHGDQGLARLRFVLHASLDADETAGTESSGLRFAEGEAVVASSLAPQQGGRIMVWAVPTDVRVGCAAFTTAYIDRKQKQVTGAPIAYAAARSRLALYLTNLGDVEVARKRVESQLGTGNSWEQQRQYVVAPQYLVGSFTQPDPIQGFLHQLDRTLTTLQSLDFIGLAQMFQDSLQLYQPAQAVQVTIKDIIVGAAEAKLMARLRMMRWQGLSALGYTFFEGRKSVEIEQPVDVSEQYRRIEELDHSLAGSQMFGAELAWLKPYIANELTIMKVELDGG